MSSSISYELAAELKGAGFPQSPPTNPHLHPDYRDGVKFPTLSELIEACGDEFIGLRRHKIAGVEGVIRWQIEMRPVLYKTPEEAVARLWLALNKSDTITRFEK